MNVIALLIRIDGELEEVYRKVATLDGIAAWFAEATSEDYEPGNRLTLFSEDSCEFNVVSMKPNSEIEWDCVSEDNIWSNTKIRFSFERGESKTFEDSTGESLVCGVAVRNTEQWLNLMQAYLAETLDIPAAEFSASQDPTDLIKQALKRVRQPDQNASDVVANIVRDAPPAAFKAMLGQESFRHFYSDCRAEALKVDCQVTNEL